MKPDRILLRFAVLSSALILSTAVHAQTLTVDASRCTADVNPAMYGIFFEDINFAADGGLYAELVKNRSFEFPQHLTGWQAFGNVSIATANPAFPRNPHYAHLVCDDRLTGTGLENEGFAKGMGLKKDGTYRFSVYLRTPDTATLIVELVNGKNENLLEKEIKVEGKTWHKVTELLPSPFTDAHARLRIRLVSGTVDLDHVSLFPTDTWQGRENGLRRDLAQLLYDLNPGVMRFPGGCIVEGNSLATRYQWKNTVGPVENRPLNENRWNYCNANHFCPDYFQSYGLGFFEFFQLAEDIGAEPLPVLSCGLACQFASMEMVPVDSLQPFIDDALDLVEFANGDVSTTWGKVRAEMGHPAPFNLKMIAIGNEQWGNVYPERLAPFVKAIRSRYPKLQIIGSAGPYSDGEEFDYLWPEMRRLGADLVDEHYYRSPEWFLTHTDRYDKYDRNGTKVFAGEYAAHDEAVGRTWEDKENTWLSALAESAFMTGLERNADVVRLATYAPLFMHVDAWQWRPDLIWFDNLHAMRTPSYFVQQLYAQNKGTDVLATSTRDMPSRMYASAVTDSRTGEIIVKVANATDTIRQLTVDVQGLKRRILADGICTYMQCDNLKATNAIGDERIVPHTRPVRTEKHTFTLSLPKCFFGVVRIKTAPAK